MSSEAVALGLANQWGPILFGIIYGLIIGSKIQSEDINRAKYPLVFIYSPLCFIFCYPRLRIAFTRYMQATAFNLSRYSS